MPKKPNTKKLVASLQGVFNRRPGSRFALKREEESIMEQQRLTDELVKREGYPEGHVPPRGPLPIGILSKKKRK